MLMEKYHKKDLPRIVGGKWDCIFENLQQTIEHFNPNSLSDSSPLFSHFLYSNSNNFSECQHYLLTPPLFGQDTTFANPQSSNPRDIYFPNNSN